MCRCEKFQRSTSTSGMVLNLPIEDWWRATLPLTPCHTHLYLFSLSLQHIINFNNFTKHGSLSWLWKEAAHIHHEDGHVTLKHIHPCKISFMFLKVFSPTMSSAIIAAPFCTPTTKITCHSNCARRMMSGMFRPNSQAGHRQYI